MVFPQQVTHPTAPNMPHPIPLRCLTLAFFVMLPSAARLLADDPPPPPPVQTSADKTPGESLPPGVQIVKLEALPDKLEFDSKFASRQLLLTGITAAGDRIDVTRMATRELTGPQAAAVTINDHGLIRPAADGAAELRFSFAGQTIMVPITVSGMTAEYPTNFIRDVNPVMTKLGCSQGTCHGSAQGKNGFKLSLRGYDPLFDHRALTDDLMGRRFNRVVPEQSLMLLKPTGTVPHVGGAVFKPGEPGYEILKSWIARGLPLDLKTPRVAKLDIQPLNPVIALPKMKQQIRVMATYADGSTRDVTAEAFVESGNIEVLEADKQGLVTALRRGESAVLVRYEGAYAATTITVMGDRTGFVWEAPSEYNYIDTLVYQKLQKVRVAPAPICSDDEFLRRVYLDLTGLPPTSDQVRAFLADQRDSRVKRDELVDQLVGSAEFVEHWTNKWADMLQVNGKFLGEDGAWAMRNWIRQAVAANMPYDRFVFEVLTARGSNRESPPASYFKTLRAPDVVMENTTQLFLGVRFSCNKCHDHPFERWTQDQHWQLAAYFAQVQRKEDPQYAGKKIGGSDVEGALPLVEVIYDGRTGEVKHPNSGAVQIPNVPYQKELLFVSQPADASANHGPLRDQFARWAVSPQNDYFAKSYVNRLWSYLLGVGFIDPVDDIRAGNPPTNPELLDRLTKEFVEQKFDAQHMLRLICKSRVYQHALKSNRWNEDDAINYSHAMARRLPAEVLYDAVFQATGTVRRLPGMPAGSRAAMQRDTGINSPDGFLDLFGRPPRESSCECERSSGVMLGQTLNLITGPTIATAIADPGNSLTKLVADQPDDAKLVEELFLRVLNRRPDSQEVSKAITALKPETSEHDLLVAALKNYEATLAAKQVAWEKSQNGVNWTPLELGEGKSAAGATFAKEADRAVFVGGNLAKDVYTLTFDTELSNLTGLRIEALTDDRLGRKGPGRAPNGNFVLGELTVSAAPVGTPEKASAVALQNPQADFSQAGYHVSAAIDGNPTSGWAIDPQGGAPHSAAFEFAKDVAVDGAVRLTLAIRHDHLDGQHNLGKFRVSVTNGPRPLMLNGPPAEVAPLLAKPADQRSPEEQARLTAYFQKQDGELTRLRTLVEKSAQANANPRLTGAQDLVWALINTPSFLFNR